MLRLPALADLEDAYVSESDAAKVAPVVPLDLYVSGRLDSEGKGVHFSHNQLIRQFFYFLFKFVISFQNVLYFNFVFHL